MRRIDSHQHFWALARGDYGWMSPDLKPLYRDFGPHDLEPHLEAHRFEGSIVVQAAPTIEETHFLLQVAEREERVLGVVGWLPFGEPEFPDALAQLAEEELLLGVRPMIQDIEDPEWMLRPAVIDHLKLLSQTRLRFDFLVKPEQLPSVPSCLDRVPELRAVIDHCAKPALASGEWGDWERGLRALADCPSLHCKISGLITEADFERWEPSHFEAPLDVVADCFGVERTMFGSDWPVCLLAGSYAQVVHLAQEKWASRLTAAQQELFWGETAARFYGL